MYGICTDTKYVQKPYGVCIEAMYRVHMEYVLRPHGICTDFKYVDTTWNINKDHMEYVLIQYGICIEVI